MILRTALGAGYTRKLSLTCRPIGDSFSRDSETSGYEAPPRSNKSRATYHVVSALLSLSFALLRFDRRYRHRPDATSPLHAYLFALNGISSFLQSYFHAAYCPLVNGSLSKFLDIVLLAPVVGTPCQGRETLRNSGLIKIIRARGEWLRDLESGEHVERPARRSSIVGPAQAARDRSPGPRRRAYRRVSRNRARNMRRRSGHGFETARSLLRIEFHGGCVCRYRDDVPPSEVSRRKLHLNRQV